MSHYVRAMLIDDYPAVRALWERTAGVGLNESDTERAISTFLGRNPGLSAVATSDLEIVGAILCGHDGRRGYLHHLAVAESHRGRGIARDLLARCFRGLADSGIVKCNIFLLPDNNPGTSFWIHDGWTLRSDLRVLQKSITTAG